MVTIDHRLAQPSIDPALEPPPNESVVPMGELCIALWSLFMFDVVTVLGRFPSVYKRMKNCQVSSDVQVGADATKRLCTVIDVACSMYPKQALCLQRAVATTSLLRRYGIRAELVIGVHQIPLDAHAWVEVDGEVVNDKRKVQEVYQVLDRC